MDYASSIEWAEENEIEWSAYEALVVIANHHCSNDLEDFYMKHGRYDSYKAAEVLAWLGY